MPKSNNNKTYIETNTKILEIILTLPIELNIIFRKIGFIYNCKRTKNQENRRDRNYFIKNRIIKDFNKNE